MKRTITVTLNGGPVNVWHQYGTRCNPFPQMARAEDSHANRLLQELDSEPLQSVQDIRRILHACSTEFVELCCQQFKPGERVQFQVWWNE